ncbi:MAG: aminoglycoside 6-adenylyltransferase [Anaerolineales bacterium]|nr:aminoglycoside 6-adenylyltransferase [Anaerolineales bacterium]
MRSEEEMFELILGTAREDERIRVVMMNGSRANPNAPKDFFQDYDIVYFVTDAAPYTRNLEWIKRFGEMMILQLPVDMADPPPVDAPGYCYLMQFADGNRIDLSIWPVDKLGAWEANSQTIILLDKDGQFPDVPPASDKDYLPKPPTAKQFDDCTNEFWWVSPYAAKGLWRRELPYARHMAEHYVREQLDKMLLWYVGVKMDFQVCPGKGGKYLERYLEPELYSLLLQTYADADYERNWDVLLAMTELFRKVAIAVGEHFGYEYPDGDDQRVSAHLRHVRSLPRGAKEMY